MPPQPGHPFVFSEAALLADADRRAWLRGMPYFRIARGGGFFDLLSRGEGTPWGNQQLIYWENRGLPGKPEFIAHPIRCNGRSFGEAFGGEAKGLADINQDGIPDLFLMKTRSFGSYYPDAPSSFWTGKQTPNTGHNRGFSVNGFWLGGDDVITFFWAEGHRDAQGKLFFTGPHPVYYGSEPDFPFQWRTAGVWGCECCLLKLAGQDHLVVAGFGDSWENG